MPNRFLRVGTLSMKRNSLKSAFVVLLLALSLSACRFGNYKEEPKQDYKIEYLKTSAKQFQVGVQYSDPQGLTVDQGVALEKIPTSVLKRFTDPVALAIPREPEKNPTLFFNPLNVDLNQPTLLTHDQTTIQAYAESEVSQLWNNTQCFTQVVLTQEGNIAKSDEGTQTLENGKTIQITGKLNLDLMFTRYIEGECKNDLETLAACYADPSSCDATTHSASQVLYGLYANASNVLDLSQVARIKKLVYLVHFE